MTCLVWKSHSPQHSTRSKSRAFSEASSLQGTFLASWHSCPQDTSTGVGGDSKRQALAALTERSDRLRHHTSVLGTGTRRCPQATPSRASVPTLRAVSSVMYKDRPRCHQREVSTEAPHQAVPPGGDRGHHCPGGRRGPGHGCSPVALCHLQPQGTAPVPGPSTKGVSGNQRGMRGHVRDR